MVFPRPLSNEFYDIVRGIFDREIDGHGRFQYDAISMSKYIHSCSLDNMNPMDLIIKNVRLVAAPYEAQVDIAIAGGHIAAIGPGLAGECESYDAGGRLACAGLV